MAETRRQGVAQDVILSEAKDLSLGEILRSLKRSLRMTILLSLFWKTDKALACPMCADLLERGQDALKAFRFAQGISWSISLMMLMPFLLIGGFIWMIRREARRQSAGKEIHGPQS